MMPAGPRARSAAILLCLFLVADPGRAEPVSKAHKAVATSRGDLATARAHWVERGTLLWDVAVRPGERFLLHFSPRGTLHLDPRGVGGGQSVALHAAGEPDEALRRRFPHLARLSAFAVDPADLGKVGQILKGQIALSARDAHGHLLDATSVQIPGVLDHLYRYDGPLGVTFEAGIPTLRVWAPTARSVTLHLAPSSSSAWREAVAMTGDAATGVWKAVGKPDWRGQFYLYEVEVFAPATGKVEMNMVTDPWSVSLSSNSRRSQIVALDDPALQPPGWTALVKPPLEAFEDIVVYELHIRDFSIRDQTLPGEERGTFKAFTHADSNGMRHLRALAESGLTHVHLLPAFDFATVNENRNEREEPDAATLGAFPGHSGEQAAIAELLKEKDGFNWGYDPLHYTVPEGSYATNPDGPVRILEFREMVASLARAGLRVVMDVVYNHTHASGQDAASILDRIVPGYYHRLNADGHVENSTCCSNTASEHAMMEKLMLDSVLTWARAYKVDGFRFDLMGHHMVDNMLRLRHALDALTPEQDGVDGRKIYLYGEGWDFGEVGGGARGRNATQRNIGGTGIGVFNDRLRDAVRGGGVFGGIEEQGFVTGLFDDPNATPQGGPEEQRARALRYADWIRLGLAGNLRDYRFESADGRELSGGELEYGGGPAGYCLDPQENVVYVSAHDNETLFDAIQWKAAPEATRAERVRMQNLGLDLILLAQGVPFVHAGDDMLRSKSLDRNSYNSGDWWNALDFTYESNNWAVGLPPGENKKNWPRMAPLLADPTRKPRSEDIRAAAAHFREMLRIRRSTRLLRLRRVDEVQQRLRFLNTGPGQIPGLLVMTIDNSGESRLADPFAALFVVVNARKADLDLVEAPLKGVGLSLHPVQTASADALTRASRFDPATGRLFVPGRTTAVFVLPAR